MDVEGGLGAANFLDPIPEDVSVVETQNVMNLSKVSRAASSSNNHKAALSHNTTAGTAFVDGKNNKWNGKRKPGRKLNPNEVLESDGSTEAVLLVSDDLSDANASLGGANVEVIDPFSSSPKKESPDLPEPSKANLFSSPTFQKWATIGLVVLLVLAIVVGVGMYIILSRIPDPALEADGSLFVPSLQPTTDTALPPFGFVDKAASIPSLSPTISTYTPQEIETLDSAFLKVYGTTEENLYDLDTPEGKGRDWMVYSDTPVAIESEQKVQQRYILAVLHHATDGISWRRRAQWMDADKSECAWFGVTCDERNGIVERIDLPQNNITGAFPKGIGSLSNLRALNMSMNALSSTIPDKLFDLIDGLVEFDVHENQLTGSIPPKTSSSSALRHIDLGENQLVGDCPFFPDLQYLRLDRNNLASIDLRYSTSSPLLQELRAYSNRLSGPLPQVWNSPSLKELDLGYNAWTGTIPRDLWNLPDLKTLFLDHSNLTGTLPSSCENQKMHRLWLDSNSLSGEIPSMFGWNWTKLYTVKLQNNRFTGNITTDQCNQWEAVQQALFEKDNDVATSSDQSGPAWELETDCEVNCACCTNTTCTNGNNSTSSRRR